MAGSCVNFSFSGWGVFAKNDISKGSFLLEYRGRHNLMKDMKIQLEHYKKKGLSFVYEYEVDNVKYWYVFGLSNIGSNDF